MTRIAVLDRERCRPRDCGNVCYKYCPMVRSKVDAIKFEGVDEKPVIIETLCSGCGICVKKCPFKSILIVNLPDELEEGCSHRFGQNMFKLYGLPVPQFGAVTGLIGKNGVGKTTALKVLSGEVKPNLGNFKNPPDWKQIITHYRGSLLQDYFQRMKDGGVKVVLKPQYVDTIPKVISGSVDKNLEKIDERDKKEEVEDRLQLTSIRDRNIDVLSGGELQRVAIAAAVCREADIYLFDEPSSYLDVKQRIEVAKIIRSLRVEGKAVLVAEHDLAVLDYLSDLVCILYGEPSVYGIISHPYGVRTGINIYLEGYIPDRNLRFREQPVRFHVKPPTAIWMADEALISWNSMGKSLDGFTLDVEPGNINKGEVIGIFGPNGIGKTTFIKLLAGTDKPDIGTPIWDGVIVSYKPQYISSELGGTAEFLIRSVIGEGCDLSLYKSEIIQPLNLEKILDHQLTELSGGELQRVAIAACLSRDAQIYLLDEPSAYLDVEERLAMAKTIRRIVESRNVTAFVAEHDISAQDFIADRIMVFDGEPGIKGHAHSPMSLRDGMNAFLEEMKITFRRDTETRRPRINKEGSRLDRHQKEIGEYYYIPIETEE